MSDDATLMAHLIPRITNQVEDAATDALGYILNRSAPSREALTDLLRQGGFKMPPIARVATQVEEDGLRPDMEGYDENNVKRLIVESKFWAPLLSGQASEYLKMFDTDGETALMFIAPESRLETLWAEIVRQIDRESPETTLAPETTAKGWRSAMAMDDDVQRRLALVSWDRLLTDMSERAAGDASAVADIRQLRGLTRSRAGVSFPPIRAEELSPEFARRAVGYARLVDDVVTRGIAQGWMSTENLKATPRRYGYGRYFLFVETGEDFWFGINYVRWARRGDTPLWMRRWSDDAWSPPIRLKIGVEYHELLDDVMSQVKETARNFGANSPEE